MKHFFLFLALIVNRQVYSQQITQNIKGRVVDKQSEYPLEGAEIIVRSNQKDYWTTTDQEGFYRITNVPIGKIDIAAYYSSFEPQSFKELSLVSGKELVVNFSLSEKLESIGEVVIKAKTNRDNVTFVTTSTSSFNIEQTEQYAGSLNDVSRMAMNYAGVSGNDDSRNDIIVRGNNPSSLLWSLEGISIPNPNHYSASGSSGGPVSMVNINTLGKSDFLAGAFPANFGNTTSAAFDLKFRTGNSDTYEFVGQLGFAGAELGAEGPFSKKSKASFLVNYRYSTLELFDKMGIDLGAGTAVPKYHDGSFLVNIPTEKAGIFRIWSLAGQSKIRFLTSEEGGDNLYLDYSNSDLKTYNLTTITGVNNKFFINKKTGLFSSISWSFLDQRVQMDTLNIQTHQYDNLYKDKIITQYATIKTELKTKMNAQNVWALGSEYTLYGIDLFMSVHKANIDYENNLYKNTGLWGNYFSWKHKFSDNFTLNSGIRSQFFALNKKLSIEPRLGVSYRLNTRFKTGIAYGLHSNIHQLLAYYSNHGTQTQPVYKNTNLDFTKSHHFISSFEYSISDNLKSKIEMYYQYLFKVPVYKTPGNTYSIINSGYFDPGGAQVFFGPLYNEGKGENYGIDFTLEHPLNEGFYALFTGSLYRSLYRTYDKKWYNTAWNGGFMSSLLTGKEFLLSDKSSMHIDINLNYSGGRRYTPIDKAASIASGEAVYDTEHMFAYQLPDYFRTDIKASFKRSARNTTQEWQISLRNVFNRKNIFSQRYNKKLHDVEYTYQTGFLPVIQYRILF